ncbi:UBP1-associated protein 2B-like [Rhodamnia argentea]|uniref:UBP1-associated protein 2B-like n=1 Tax=Rhodamnia argentea TaxID=178133 RepID=A0A8B8NF61_9MYRT|nr:UBP1-associated protein 2B-like [Rhodamnia argentea]
MAKKRKTIEPEPQPPPPKEVSEEEEEDEDEDEDEEEGESASEEQEDEEESESESSEDEDEASKRETIKQLLEPFTKDQLITVLLEASANNPSLVSQLVKSTESDPVHRKIFVHGLAWDATDETLTSAFKPFGPIEECKAVTDKATDRCKGYGFVLFKTRAATQKALKEPQKKIGNRMASCQLAAAGPPSAAPVSANASSRKMYIANVAPQVSPEKLRAFFAKFGEIDDGPLGMDRVTGKFRGFAIIVYKSLEGINKALQEPVKDFEGMKLECSPFVEGRNSKTVKKAAPAAAAMGGGAVGIGGASTTLNNVGFQNFPVGLNQGLVGQNYHPAVALLGQNAGLGLLNPLLGFGGGSLNQVVMNPSFPGAISAPLNRNSGASMGLNAGFGVQQDINTISPSVINAYNSQAALPGFGAYQNSLLGQTSASGVSSVGRGQPGAGSAGSNLGR